jgi:hypothetical protein
MLAGAERERSFHPSQSPCGEEQEKAVAGARNHFVNKNKEIVAVNCAPAAAVRTLHRASQHRVSRTQQKAAHLSAFRDVPRFGGFRI